MVAEHWWNCKMRLQARKALRANQAVGGDCSTLFVSAGCLLDDAADDDD